MRIRRYEGLQLRPRVQKIARPQSVHCALIDLLRIADGDSCSGANLSGADLTRANLTCADLPAADLPAADLSACSR
ncbi:MAG: pentapeptide repeat-containing protein, partial [Pseudomonadota bacterium]